MYPKKLVLKFRNNYTEQTMLLKRMINVLQKNSMYYGSLFVYSEKVHRADFEIALILKEAFLVYRSYFDFKTNFLKCKVLPLNFFKKKIYSVA